MVAAALLVEAFAVQRERIFLWVSVAFACGIGTYFTLLFETDFMLLGLVAAGAVLLAVGGSCRWQRFCVTERCCVWRAVAAVVGFVADRHWCGDRRALGRTWEMGRGVRSVLRAVWVG